MISFVIATAIAVAGGWFIEKNLQLAWASILLGLGIGAVMGGNEIIQQLVRMVSDYRVGMTELFYAVSIAYFTSVTTIATLWRSWRRD